MSKGRNSASGESRQVIPRWRLEERREERRLDSWRLRVRLMASQGVDEETIRDIVGCSETEFYSFFQDELMVGYDGW